MGDVVTPIDIFSRYKGQHLKAYRFKVVDRYRAEDGSAQHYQTNILAVLENTEKQ